MYNGIQITKNPAVFSGRPIINGHRVTVHDIVVRHHAGMSLEELAEGYGLTPEEISAGLEYYAEHKAAIDRQIAADRHELARRAAEDSSPLAERMREVGRDQKRRRAQ
jgi:uncharacterized protein (DUF433 family)